jgi:hypothetical protein
LTLQAMASLMHQGRRLATVSWLLAAAALAWLLLVALACRGQSQPACAAIGASLVAGAVQAWFAVRVDFDARLFAALATQASAHDAAVRLDATLIELGLVERDAGSRDWPSRWRGARGLLRRQGVCLALQALALAAGLLLTQEGTCWNA